MQKSKLSSELRSELKEYTNRLQRLDMQEKRVRELMTHEGVFDDIDRLSEAAGRLPSCYLRFSFFERFYELKPRTPPNQTSEE